jgi:hypothetical protein
MDPNVDSTTDEDFDNRPLKKAKNPESIVLDNPLPSPPVSEVMNEDNTLPSPPVSEPMNEDNPLPSPTVSELMNEETEPKHIIDDVTYDYLPQGKIFSYYLYFCYVSVIIYTFAIYAMYLYLYS